MYSSHRFGGMENAGGTEEVAGGGFHIGDSVLDLTRSPILSPRSSSCNQFGGLGNVSAQALEMAAADGRGGRLCFQRGDFENGADSRMVVGGLRADVIDPFGRIRELVDEEYAAAGGGGCGGGGYGGDGRLSMDSSALSMEKTGDDDKILRRLAQNREAARKSRIRKKV